MHKEIKRDQCAGEEIGSVCRKKKKGEEGFTRGRGWIKFGDRNRENEECKCSCPRGGLVGNCSWRGLTDLRSTILKRKSFLHP